MRFARQTKGTNAEEAFLVAAELQEAAIVYAHLPLYQVHCCLHLCNLIGLYVLTATLLLIRSSHSSLGLLHRRTDTLSHAVTCCMSCCYVLCCAGLWWAVLCAPAHLLRPITTMSVVS